MISTHAPAGGATLVSGFVDVAFTISTHAPAGGATGAPARPRPPPADFYSHPCGRGDSIPAHWCVFEIISTHAPAGGATRSTRASRQSRRNFYSRPCGRGDTPSASLWRPPSYFYSRPCGRGDDVEGSAANTAGVFLLTPLREGRHTAAAPVNPTSCISTHAPAGGATRGTSCPCLSLCNFYSRPCGRGDLRDFPVFHVGIAISTHAPAGGATHIRLSPSKRQLSFLLTPLREGRHKQGGYDIAGKMISTHAPAGGATGAAPFLFSLLMQFLLTPLREGRPAGSGYCRSAWPISTHAPAGGATAIFHKSVMRFCGKLPKDDTVLCLASFGFPRRDPKAVYLAWISCANLPQKCVRQGLALKDQGTSCFHEGLASHAFDPVLV